VNVPSPAWPEAPELTFDPVKESSRVNELRSLKLLDSQPEDRFDRITRLAASFFRVPTAYVALLDNKRQWLKSRVGTGPIHSPRSMTFCQYTISQAEPLVMPDTREHPIGRNHPMVIGKPQVRFYAGVPLAGPTGKKIGTFCLVDFEPREFSEADLASLIEFAALVEREINLGGIIQAQRELLQTRQRLMEAKHELERELSDAAKYVRQMLPPPLLEDEIIDWHFHPSMKLGGDGLGYRRIDRDQIAFYMLDVTGHGLGSALLAVTTLELLRNRNSASRLDFARPAEVIERLNRSFQMKDHDGKFFSAWYGVYSRSKRTITYANAGHPPALLLTHKNGRPILHKTTPGTSVLGIMPHIEIPETTFSFPAGSELFLFTDGLYESLDPKGGRGSYDEFLAYLQAGVEDGAPVWEAMHHWHEESTKKKLIDDDVSMLRFATRG
jgi:sigma-B regulation protein RsbU (phosphoserine phosphatase)